MFDQAVGGDDYLHNKKGGSTLAGDAELMADTARGGNDVLSGSAGNDVLVGDAVTISGQSSGGDDVLLGGKGDDRLHGDAITFDGTGEHGADRFVFAGASGKDTILDFEQGKDVIDVAALGYTDIGQLTIEVSGDDSIVRFLGGSQVAVVGVTTLSAADFLLA
jgi:Ca2+-binding RTX toxin-like protein